MEPLELNDILAMDDETLNLTIETSCTTHVWEYIGTDNLVRGAWQLEHPDVPHRLWSSVPYLHYTAFWDMLMPVWWTWGRQVGLVRLHDGECWVSLPSGLAEADGTMIRQSMLRCTTEAETRRAVAQMTLWNALWQQRQVRQEAARGNT